MGLALVTPPAAPVLTDDDMIAHLRIGTVDTPPDDLMLVRGYLAAATDAIEQWTRRRLITQTWKTTYDAFPWGGVALELPYPPLVAVASIVYVDAAGVAQTLAPEAYQVDTTGFLGRVAPVWGTSWPTARRQPSAVTVTFSCGYGTSGSSVPAALRAAVRLMLGHLHEMREGTISGTIIADVPLGVEALCSPYRVPVVP
jgi:uncharacterized phiE125 gp8 family phage protein